MSELYRIDDIPPRRNLKLWHLVALVTVSAVVFWIGRGLMGLKGGVGVVVLVLMFWGTIGVFFVSLALGARLANRAALAIDDWGVRQGGLSKLGARCLAILAYAVVLPGSAVTGLTILFAVYRAVLPLMIQ